MVSPLEKHPEILEKIGLFVVLFNLIDGRLNNEFYYLLDQRKKRQKTLIDFLSSQRFSQKLDLLQDSIGDALYKEVKEINEFRNFIAHGTYGEEVLITKARPLVPSGRISVTKLGQGGKKYHSRDLSVTLIGEYIEKERKILKAMYELKANS
jgi:hypothetical protein